MKYIFNNSKLTAIKSQRVSIFQGGNFILFGWNGRRQAGLGEATRWAAPPDDSLFFSVVHPVLLMCEVYLAPNSALRLLSPELPGGN